MLEAIPSTENIAAYRTRWAGGGEAAVVIGAATEAAPDKVGAWSFVPYARVFPIARVRYRLIDSSGSPGLETLLRGLLKSVRGCDSLPPRLRELRWADLRLADAVGETPAYGLWPEEATTWDQSSELARFFDLSGPWRHNLAVVAARMPLALYARPILSTVKNSSLMPPSSTPDRVVETAFSGLRLAGLLEPAMGWDDGPDRELSKIRALEEGVSNVGLKEFRRLGGVGLGTPEWKALALCTLDNGLPADWPKREPAMGCWLGKIATAKRLRREPFGRAHQRLSPYWSQPWAVPFLTEPFIAMPTQEDVAWELARWLRSRSFLQKRWALGGGRHAVLRDEARLPTTRLYPLFHFLGGRESDAQLRVAGPLRTMLLRDRSVPWFEAANSLQRVLLRLAEDSDCDEELERALELVSKPVGTSLRASRRAPMTPSP